MSLKSNTLARLLATVVLMGAVFHAKSLRADILTGPIVDPNNGYSYFLLDQSSWTDAQAQALSLNGNLATITDAADETWLFNTFGSIGGTNRSLWIGLNDVATPGTFVWASGAPVTYTDWLPGQPDNNPVDAPESYVQIIATGNGFNATPNTWNDSGNSGTAFQQLGPVFGVVEVVPEPSSVALLIAGAALGVRRFGRRACPPNS